MKKFSQLLACLAVGTMMVACDRTATTGPVDDAMPDALQSRAASKQYRTAYQSHGIVYVIHGINGTDLGLPEALPVDVSLNGACALTDFRFRDITGPIKLDAGTYDIQVHLGDATPCAGAVAIDAPGVVLPAGANVSIAAHLSDAGAPTASVFINDVSRTYKARVGARHIANFGPVDILVNDGVAFANVPNGVGGTADLRPGKYNIAIAIAGTDTRAFEADVRLRPSQFLIAYAVGTPANGTFEVLIQKIPLHRKYSRGYRPWN